MQAENKEKWNKKTQTFPRYDVDNNKFQNKIAKILQENKYLDTNYSILDIGCGTGIFTLTLANKVKSVLGVDLSNQMLDYLKKDACKNNINNVNTVISSLDKFESQEKYDLVFASRTPAMSEEKDYIKITSLSKKFVAYLGFSGFKESNIQRELKKNHHFTFHEFNEIKDIKNWLEKSSKKYNKFAFEERFSRPICEELALKYINEYLEYTEEEVTQEEINIIIQSLKQDDKLSYNLDTKMELLLWEN